MSKRKRKNRDRTPEELNLLTFYGYLDNLTNLALSSIEWHGLPDTVDGRYIEFVLLYQGMAVYFDEPDVGNLCLNVRGVGGFDVYNVPIRRIAYSQSNEFNRTLYPSDSVIIYNNYMRQPTIDALEMFAWRLANIDRTIDVNVMGQKTPKLLLCSENQRLVIENMYKQYTGNYPAIFGDKRLDFQGLQAIDTTSPFVSDKLQIVKRQIFNEALTYLGIENNSNEKAERLVRNEAISSAGATQANRFTRIAARQDACEKINRMFGTNISVDYRAPLSIDLIQEENEQWQNTQQNYAPSVNPTPD